MHSYSSPVYFARTSWNFICLANPPSIYLLQECNRYMHMLSKDILRNLICVIIMALLFSNPWQVVSLHSLIILSISAGVRAGPHAARGTEKNKHCSSFIDLDCWLAVYFGAADVGQKLHIMDLSCRTQMTDKCLAAENETRDCFLRYRIEFDVMYQFFLVVVPWTASIAINLS